MNPTRFANKYGPWAVVTGASDGIGRAFARELARLRLNVLLVARRHERLEALRAELVAQGVEAIALPLDLAGDQTLDALIEASATLDVGLLVAAAGFGTSGPFIESDLERELRMLDVNCRAVTRLAHHFGGRLARRGRGGMVLMSSLVAFQGVPRAAHYAATKVYNQSLAEGLRLELHGRGVDVIACAPGPVSSGFGEQAGMDLRGAPAPEVVAGPTLRALGRRDTARPGFLAKFLEASLSLLPRWGRVRVLRQVMAGMTRRPG